MQTIEKLTQFWLPVADYDPCKRVPEKEDEYLDALIGLAEYDWGEVIDYAKDIIRMIEDDTSINLTSLTLVCQADVIQAIRIICANQFFSWHFNQEINKLRNLRCSCACDACQECDNH